MAKRLYKSYPRLEQILARQGGPTRWLSDYQPANIINDADTPTMTRPSELSDPYLQRDLQGQARTERPWMLLALHNPATYDAHEQHMLPFNAAQHPLSNHESMRGHFLPGLRGTLAIADSLGCLNKHPRVRAPANHPKYPNQLLPFPFIGDILIFVRDTQGLFAVNWSIKATESDFQRTFRSRRKPTTKEDQERAELRHEIERLLFLDGQIPTHHLYPALIDENLRVNLLHIYYWYARDPINESARVLKDEVTAWYCEQLPLVRVMYDLIKDAARHFRLEVYDAQWILKTAIFTRRMRVELFRVVENNLPLLPEIHDPFERYAEWFRRPT